MKKALLTSLMLLTVIADAAQDNGRHRDNHRDRINRLRDRITCNDLTCCCAFMFLVSFVSYVQDCSCPSCPSTGLAAPGSIDIPGELGQEVCTDGPKGQVMRPCSDWYDMNWCPESSGFWIDNYNSNSGCGKPGSCPPLSSQASHIKPGSTYTHTPSGKEYKIDARGVARHRKTCEEYVGYGIAGGDRLWMMPIREFTSNVTVDGQNRQVFKLKNNKQKKE
jgi:hypothetical protein